MKECVGVGPIDGECDVGESDGGIGERIWDDIKHVHRGPGELERYCRRYG